MKTALLLDIKYTVGYCGIYKPHNSQMICKVILFIFFTCRWFTKFNKHSVKNSFAADLCFFNFAKNNFLNKLYWKYMK